MHRFIPCDLNICDKLSLNGLFTDTCSGWVNLLKWWQDHQTCIGLLFWCNKITSSAFPIFLQVCMVSCHRPCESNLTSGHYSCSHFPAHKCGCQQQIWHALALLSVCYKQQELPATYQWLRLIAQYNVFLISSSILMKNVWWPYFVNGRILCTLKNTGTLASGSHFPSWIWNMHPIGKLFTFEITTLWINDW